MDSMFTLRNCDVIMLCNSIHRATHYVGNGKKTITESLEIQAPHIYLGKQYGEEFAYAAENAEQE